MFGAFPLFRDSLSDRVWSGGGGDGTFRIVQRGVEGSGNVEAGGKSRKNDVARECDRGL